MDNIRTKPSSSAYRKGWDAIFIKPLSDEMRKAVDDEFNNLCDELGVPKCTEENK